MARRHTLLTVGAIAIGLRLLPLGAATEQSETTAQATQPVQAIAKPQSQPKNATSISAEKEWMVLRAYIRGAIYWPEGTWYPGTTKNPYKIRYTFVTFDSFQDHPDFLGAPLPCGYIPSLRRNVCSAASGAGQWMPGTWREMERSCPNLDKSKERFGPVNQDLAVICKLGLIGSYWELMKGVFVDSNGKIHVKRENFDRSIYKAAPTWASLPTGPKDGLGAHNQGAKSINEIWAMFSQELEKEQRSQ